MELQEPKKKTRQRSPQKQLEIIERGHRILSLRRDGASLRAISAALIKEAEAAGSDTRGYSYENVRKNYNALITMLAENNLDVAMEVRELTTQRLENVILNYTPYTLIKIDGLSSDNDLQMKKKAGDTVVKAALAIADLYGARKPLKHEITGENGSPLNLTTQIIVEFTDTPGNVK
jgi:hypothetical protein